MALKNEHRRINEAVPSGQPAAGEDQGVLKGLSVLQAFLRETCWEDGDARQTATLMLFAEDGRWKVMLNDRDAGCVAFVSGETVRACLSSLDKGLNDGTLDWRASRQDKGRKRG